MPNPIPWELINSLATWLSAIGTLAAVVTSLYLARRDARIDLMINAGLRMLVLGGKVQASDFIYINLTNLGRRGARVTQLYWKTGILWKKIYVWIPQQNDFSARIPVKLSDGDEAIFLSTLADFESSFSEIANDVFSGWFGGLKARFIRVGVCTSSGDKFEKRLEKNLRQYFLKIAKAQSGYPMK